MSSFVVENNVESLVANSPILNAGSTTLDVTTGEGTNFPSTFPFLITLWDESSYPDPSDDSSMEIVRCTGRTTDALTIVRAQEGTADVPHLLGVRVAMLITAGIFNDATYGIATKLDVILSRISTTLVAFNATGQTTLYTVPTGKTFIPVMAIIRAGADAGATDITFGRVGALTDWLGTIQLDNLDAAGDQVKIETTNANPPTKSKTYAAAQVFQIDVTVANGGATNYVDLFGYLVAT